MKNVEPETANHSRVRIQFQSRDEITQHPACSFLKVRFPGLDRPTTEADEDLEEIRCFPIQDPYRPGVLDVLMREDDEKLDWSKVAPGYPVQVRGFWSWDLFPKVFDPQEGKDAKTTEQRGVMWSDQAKRKALTSTPEKEATYFSPMEKRVCIITDVTGIGATLQIMNEVMALESGKHITIICVFDYDKDMPLKRELDRMATVTKNLRVHVVLLNEPEAEHRKPLKKGFYNPWEETNEIEANPWNDIAHVGTPTAEVLRRLVPPPEDQKYGPCRLVLAARLDDYDVDLDQIEGNFSEITLEDQLQDLGYRPEQVTVLSMDD